MKPMTEAATTPEKPLLSYIEVERLMVLYTDKCDMACEHCVASAGPKGTRNIEPDILSERLMEAAELGIQKIGFSGGECLLYFEDILRLVDECQRWNIKCSITTNGNWAQNDDIVATRLSALGKAGLHTLEISYDYFHRRAGGSLRCVERVIRECNRLGIVASLRMLRRAGADPEFWTVEKELRQLGLKYDRQINSLRPYGRAASTLPETRVYYEKQPIDTISGCDSLGVLTYMPNGDLRPCCGGIIGDVPTSDNATFLRIGNIYKDTLRESLSTVHNGQFFAIMALVGPAGFTLLAREHGIDLRVPNEVHSPCDVCMLAAHSPEFTELMKILDENLESVLKRVSAYQSIMDRWGLLRNTAVKLPV